MSGNHQWTAERGPQPGDLIKVVDETVGVVDDRHLYEVVDHPDAVPAEELADSMPWKCWWSVRVLRVQGDGCEACTDQSAAMTFLLAADSFVKVGAR